MNVATTEYTVEVCWSNSFSNIDDWWPCWFSWGGGHHPKVAWLWGQTFPLLATTSHTMKVCWSRCQPLRIWAMAFHSDQVRMAKAKAKDVAMAMAKASINERKSLEWLRDVFFHGSATSKFSQAATRWARHLEHLFFVVEASGRPILAFDCFTKALAALPAFLEPLAGAITSTPQVPTDNHDNWVVFINK